MKVLFPFKFGVLKILFILEREGGKASMLPCPGSLPPSVGNNWEDQTQALGPQFRCPKRVAGIHVPKLSLLPPGTALAGS